MGMEPQIIKETGEGGKVIYKLKGGGQIETYTEELYDMATLGLSLLDSFFDLLLECECRQDDGIPDLAKELIESAEAKLSEAERFIAKNYGTVLIERASYRQPDIMGGTMLGVVFRPANGKAPEQPAKDHPGA